MMKKKLSVLGVLLALSAIFASSVSALSERQFPAVGDDFNTLLWVIVLGVAFVALAAFAIIFFVRRKKNAGEDADETPGESLDVVDGE